MSNLRSFLRGALEETNRQIDIERVQDIKEEDANRQFLIDLNKMGVENELETKRQSSYLEKQGEQMRELESLRSYNDTRKLRIEYGLRAEQEAAKQARAALAGKRVSGYVSAYNNGDMTFQELRDNASALGVSNKELKSLLEINEKFDYDANLTRKQRQLDKVRNNENLSPEIKKAEEERILYGNIVRKEELNDPMKFSQKEFEQFRKNAKTAEEAIVSTENIMEILENKPYLLSAYFDVTRTIKTLDDYTGGALNISKMIEKGGGDLDNLLNSISDKNVKKRFTKEDFRDFAELDLNMRSLIRPTGLAMLGQEGRGISNREFGEILIQLGLRDRNQPLAYIQSPEEVRNRVGALRSILVNQYVNNVNSLQSGNVKVRQDLINEVGIKNNNTAEEVKTQSLVNIAGGTQQAFQLIKGTFTEALRNSTMSNEERKNLMRQYISIKQSDISDLEKIKKLKELSSSITSQKN